MQNAFSYVGKEVKTAKQIRKLRTSTPQISSRNSRTTFPVVKIWSIEDDGDEEPRFVAIFAFFFAFFGSMTVLSSHEDSTAWSEVISTHIHSFTTFYNLYIRSINEMSLNDDSLLSVDFVKY